MHTKLRPSGARRGYPGAESGQREPRGHLPGAHGSWPRSPSYHKAFHDVTTGNNQVTAGPATAGYQASPG